MKNEIRNKINKINLSYLNYSDKALKSVKDKLFEHLLTLKPEYIDCTINEFSGIEPYEWEELKDDWEVIFKNNYHYFIIPKW